MSAAAFSFDLVWITKALDMGRYQSGSFSLINVGSGITACVVFRCFPQALDIA